ncbi:MAG TPA: hypothetical protein VFA27_15195 [Vicinamibacterales bacterium]|nr:hypothetical protein [Vicinamibacterales bacterium]
MMPSIFRLSLALAVLAVTCACSGSDSSTSSTTSPSQTITTDVLTGTVPAPINGVLQSAANNFAVGQGGGTVNITLTSATETLPNGTLLTTVAMGLAVGTSSITGCTPLANSFTTAQASGTPQLSGSLAAGAYCVIVSDVTNQVGPVAYAVAVSHP